MTPSPWTLTLPRSDVCAAIWVAGCCVWRRSHHPQPHHTPARCTFSQWTGRAAVAALVFSVGSGCLTTTTLTPLQRHSTYSVRGFYRLVHTTPVLTFLPYPLHFAGMRLTCLPHLLRVIYPYWIIPPYTTHAHYAGSDVHHHTTCIPPASLYHTRLPLPLVRCHVHTADADAGATWRVRALRHAHLRRCLPPDATNILQFSTQVCLVTCAFG